MIASARLGQTWVLLAGLVGLGLSGCLASSSDGEQDTNAIEQAGDGDGDAGAGDGDGDTSSPGDGDGDGESDPGAGDGDGDPGAGDGDGDPGAGDGDRDPGTGDSGDGDSGDGAGAGDGDTGGGAGDGDPGDAGAGDGDPGGAGAGDGDPADAGAGDAGAGDGDASPLCGTRGATPCKKDEYCYFPPRAQCGATDLGGTCRPLIKDLACTQQYDPVCGCDGKTYGNACEANRAGVSIAGRGVCGESSAGETCGGIAGLSCADGAFCNYGKDAGGQGCEGIADAAGVCQEQPTACTRDYRPVCGCNRHSYSNACSAHAAGVSVLRGDLCTDDDCTSIGGRVAFGQGPPPRCNRGETSVGPVRLSSGQVPLEGAICCI